MYWCEKEECMKMTPEEWEQQAKFQAEHDFDKLNKEEVGSHIIVTIKEKEKYNTKENQENKRVFIDSLEFIHNHYSKEGWWDIFTLTNKPIEKYGCSALAHIVEFRKDKNGFLMCIVEIDRYFDHLFTNEDKENEAWLFFMGYRLISNRFVKLELRDFYGNKYNPTNIMDKYKEYVPENLENVWERYNYLAIILFNYIKEGRDDIVTLSMLHKLLISPTPEENAFKEFTNNFITDIFSTIKLTTICNGQPINLFGNYKTKIGNYPITLEKLVKRIQTFKWTHEKEDFLKSYMNEILTTYKTLILEGKLQPSDKVPEEKNINNLDEYYFERMEAVNKIYYDKKQKEKEERKRKRKERKENENKT